MNTVEIPQLVALDETCRVLGDISRQTVWRLARAGELEIVAIGRRTFFTAESIRDLIERSRQPAPLSRSEKGLPEPAPRAAR